MTEYEMSSLAEKIAKEIDLTASLADAGTRIIAKIFSATSTNPVAFKWWLEDTILKAAAIHGKAMGEAMNGKRNN